MLLPSLLLYFLYFENFQKTALSHIDSDETGSRPIWLNGLRTSETNCNNWSLISLQEGLCVCAPGSGDWNWSSESLQWCVLILVVFLHFLFVCLFFSFGFNCPFLNQKALRKQNILYFKTHKEEKFTPKWGKE